MNRIINGGPRFSTGRPYSSGTSTPPPVTSTIPIYAVNPGKDFLCSTPPPLGDAYPFSKKAPLSLDSPQVRALWTSKNGLEAIGSDFSCSSSTSTFDDNTTNFTESVGPAPTSNRVGNFAFAHQKALAARERYLTQNSPIKDPKLNPRASAFVPLTTTPPPSATHPSLPPNSLPCWFPAFSEATRGPLNDPAQRKQKARNLASAFQWNRKNVAELAQHFCWTGSNFEGETRTAELAFFALNMYQELSKLRGVEIAGDFLWHLRECSVGTYMAFWDLTTSPQAISFQTTDPSYVRSALSLTSFVGDLFNRGLLCAFQTMTCVRTLVRNTISIDHLHALHKLIVHAGKELWYTHPSEITSGEGKISVLPIQAVRMTVVGFKDDVRRQMMKMGNPSLDSRQRGLLASTAQEREMMLGRMWALLDKWTMDA